MFNMAMKFWFGKKESDGAPLDAAKQPVGDGVSGVPAAVGQPEGSASGYDLSLQIDGTALLAVQPMEEKVEPVVPVPGPAPAVLKAVGGAAPALRLAPRAPEAGATPEAVAPAAAVPMPQPVSATAPAAAPKPVFALRVKTNDAVPDAGAASPATMPAMPAADSADERQGAAAAAPNDWVRPKPDQRVLYYQLMDGLYDAILILDDQGHVVDGSKRITELLGYSREETWDMPIEKVITGMSRQMFEHLRRNLKENHHILIDARCFRKDGTSFAGEVGVSTLALTRSSNMVFAIRNVERRKNAMDEMRRGQAAFELSLSPGFVCDVDGFFQVVNPALLEAFGIPNVEQAKRVRFVDLLPDAARLFLRAACGDKGRETVKVSVANEVSVALELALAPLKNGQTVTGVAGAMRQPT
jgi:PAS domain S-box-containing protein